MPLTAHQQQAFDAIIAHLRGNGATPTPTAETIPRIVLLQGSAGTGKTTLTKYIADYFQEAGNVAVCAIAPTHKAKRVISGVLNASSVIPIATVTIASALSKIREHSNIGTKLYGQANIKKLSSYGLFLVDEVSMISDADMKTLVNYVIATKKMALLIGDNNQIPCPSAGFVRVCHGSVETTNAIEKADNYVFNCPQIYKVELTEVVRQAKESPIIRLATHIREHINDDITLPDFSAPHMIPYDKIYEKYVEYIGGVGGLDTGAAALTRVIAYTNAAVRTHNLELRRILHPDDMLPPFVVGDILMGYTSAGQNDVIENGQDYSVTAVTPTSGYKVGGFAGLCGWFLNLQLCNATTNDDDDDYKQIIRDQFFINIYASANKAYVNELIKRAQKVNAVGSSGVDWRAYKELKTPVLFIDDVYKYGGKIYTDTTFRESHSLLFTNINELVDMATNAKRPSQLLTRIENEYSGVIDSRLEDTAKRLCDSEQLADAYKVIERDIYYGYAITAHKSQGSTYNNVIVDEGDFSKLVNRWNNKHGCMESRVREKNQLRYVAYTRAKYSLAIAWSSGDDHAEQGSG